MLLNPDATEMHELILNSMNYDAMEPFLLEVICLIAMHRGTADKHFRQIFKRKPWLFEQAQPELELHIKPSVPQGA